MGQPPPYDSDCRFPAFWSLFDSNSEIKVPWYLALLGLQNHPVAAVAVVKECCRADPSGGQIEALLDGDNWRMHLVAATAVLVSTPGDGLSSALWQRIELGSWVVPQLCAVASIVDPDFERRAERLRFDLTDRFHTTDDRSPRFGLAKTICSLSALCQTAPAVAADILDYDRDQAGDIARVWRHNAMNAQRESGS